MAASYGVLPQVILTMPWKALKRLMQSFNKRQRRELKMQAGLRGLDGLGLFSGGTTGGDRNLGKTEVDVDQTVTTLGMSGFSIR